MSHLKDFNPFGLKNSYEGNARMGKYAWVQKCGINLDELTFECNYPANSILLNNEYVSSICEYAQDSLLVFCNPVDCLVVVDWNPVRRIVETEPGNVDKNWQQVIPSFDQDESPFIITSGRQKYSVLNVSSAQFESLIEGSANNIRC